MKSFFPLLVLMALLVTGCGQTVQSAQNVPDVKIALIVQPDPPSVGESLLTITLTDSSGKPINGAAVKVHGDMDHAGMEPVDGETSSGVDGKYRILFNWTMGGGWIITVTATLSDGSVATEKFDLFVGAVSNESIINQTDTQKDKMPGHK